MSSRPKRSDRLLRALDAHPRVVVVTHDFPDPDALAAGWALHRLCSQKLNATVELVGGGEIVRAENRFLVDLLGPPLKLVVELPADPDAAYVLVDCGPHANNHLLARSAAAPTAIIDHHRTSQRKKGDKANGLFMDVRPKVAATVSIAASYLHEQSVEPTMALATAMLYAMRTETLGHETYFSALDRRALTWLTARADPSRLAKIENAPLPRVYFSDLVLALQGTFIYDDTAFCVLPSARGPETAAEVADLLVRCADARHVLCAARIGCDLMLSVRTRPDAEDAGALVRKTLEGLGQGGGHEHRAGGKIPDATRGSDHVPNELIDDLRHRWLVACKSTRQRGTRLVPRRDIVGNL